MSTIKATITFLFLAFTSRSVDGFVSEEEMCICECPCEDTSWANRPGLPDLSLPPVIPFPIIPPNIPVPKPGPHSDTDKNNKNDGKDKNKNDDKNDNKNNDTDNTHDNDKPTDKSEPTKTDPSKTSIASVSRQVCSKTATLTTSVAISYSSASDGKWKTTTKTIKPT